MVVAQLVERSLPIPEVCGLNPVIGKNLLILNNYCILSTVYWKDKNKEKEAGNGPFLKCFCCIPEVRGSNPVIGKILLILNICLLSTVYWIDENKEKEARNGPFFNKKESEWSKRKIWSKLETANWVKGVETQLGQKRLNRPGQGRTSNMGLPTRRSIAKKHWNSKNRTL